MRNYLVLTLSIIALNLSLNQASSSTNININNSSLNFQSLQQAQQLYKQGRLTEALQVLQAIASDTENTAQSAIALRNLALIYQQLGEWEEAKTAISQAINILPGIANHEERQSRQAQIFDVQGQLQLSQGQPEQALETWKQATEIYQEIGDLTRFTKSQIYQAQALQALGLYAQALKTLTRIQEPLQQEPDSQIKVKALQTIGEVLRRVGKYEESQLILQESLAIAKNLNNPQLMADSLLSLGNTARLLEPQAALKFYQSAIDQSLLPETQVSAQLKQLSLLIEQKQWQRAIALVPAIEEQLTQLPPHQTINARIDLAQNLLKTDSSFPIPNSAIIAHLTTAIELARLEDKSAEAEALGTLGKLYEQHQRLDEAKELTQRALVIAQGTNATNAYQWQWQLGRILKAQGEREGAIAAYSQSVKSLESLRSDLVAISSQVQYSFRESIEPVYRELVGLLLKPGASQAHLQQAREVIESLQVAELDNFFRDACLDTNPVQIDQIDPTAAIIYPIILDNRLEVIAAIPNQPLRHYANELPPSELDIVITSANSQISQPRRLNLKLLQQAYDWLIRPLEADFEATGIKTLVFVPDGILRNLPPATLHDGEQYLIEKYAVAIAPSLQLVQLQREQNSQEVLLAGLSQPRQGFSSLPGVKTEIEQIESLFASEVLLNESFTEPNFMRSVRQTPFQFVHLATHGQFSSNAEETFVLTWDERINIDELSRLLRGDRKQLHPIELLVLSACETATGDRLAALGLAGMAVRGGARSTVASLWAVSDAATVDLMNSFYLELAQGVPKAEALRRAQLSILKGDRFSHPFYWSAFILIGNWQ